MRLNPLTKGIETLHPRDAEFFYNESDGHMGHLLSVWLFDTSLHPEAELTQEQAVDWITRRLGCDRMYTNRIRSAPLGLQHPYWAPAEDFHARNHVTVTEIVEPGWAALGEHLDELVTAPMDLACPPWEMHVFNGVEGLIDMPGRLTAVVLKAYHSAGDGLGVVELGQRLFSDEDRPVDGGPRGADRLRIVRVRLLANALLAFPRGVVRLAQDIAGMRAVEEDISAAIDSGEMAAPPEKRHANRFNAMASGAAAIEPIVFARDELRRVKDAVPGATVNDVLLTVVGGALARYAADAADPACDSIIAMVPRSMRQIEKWESANQLATMFVDMHTDVEDPLERLSLVSESARGEKARTAHLSTRRLSVHVQSAPPVLLWLLARLRKTLTVDPDMTRNFQTTVSNIPRPAGDVSLNGAPVVALLGSQPPVDRDCVRHYLTVSPGGKYMLTVTADKAAIPDLPRYLAAARDCFDELKKATEA